MGKIKLTGASGWVLLLVGLFVLLLPAHAEQSEFQTLLERHAAIALLIDAASGQIVDANSAAVEFYGYDRQYLTGLSIQQINTLSPAQIAEERELAAREGRNHFIFRHKLASGDVRTVEVYSAPFGRGERPLLLSIVHDITPRRNLQQGMWHYQQRLEDLVEQHAAQLVARERAIAGLLVVLSIAALLLVLRRAIKRRRLADDRLEQFTRDFEDFLQHTPNFVYCKDAQGGIMFCSQQMALVTGHTHWRELIGKHDRDIYPESVARAYEEEEHAIFAEGRPLNNKIRPYINELGQQCYLQTSKWPRFDANGQVIGLSGISVDITEAKRAEIALQESEERHRLLFHTMTSGVVHQAADGSIIAANPAAEALLGLSLEQMKGKRSTDPNWRMITEDGTEVDGSNHPAMIVLRTGESLGPVSRGVFHPHRGTHIWLSITAIPLFRPGEEKPFQAYAIFDDITEQRQAEARIRQAASVFEHTNEGILITDAKAQIIDVNAAFTRITGYAREEVLGHNPRKLKSGRQDSAFYEQMWLELSATGHWNGEIWNRRKNGEFYAQLTTISAVKNSEGQLQRYVGLFTDITPRMERQQQLENIARHDPLTGLPNRLALEDHLDQALRLARRSGKQLAVMFIDLDRFKPINDRLGHHVGDSLLIEVGRRLRDCVRQSDIIGRLGGDEFVVLLSDLAADEHASTVAEKILSRLAEPYFVDDHRLEIGASIGISLFPDHDDTGSFLIRAADQAMYEAKRHGRNTFVYFSGLKPC